MAFVFGRAAAVCAALVQALATGVVGPCVLAWTGVQRHALSVVCTALIVTLCAGLAGASVPVALLVWLLASLVSLVTWRALEACVLRRLGCRAPGHVERERLQPLVGVARLDILVVDAAQPWLARGVRSLVVSRALLDLLEDRALAGLLTQASSQVLDGTLPGEIVVGLGNLPLLGAWWMGRSLVQLGRVLAVVVGASLVLPLVVWPDGFMRWTGRLFGTVFVCLLGSALLSSGLSAFGLGLLLAWAVVPGLHALVRWESRRAEMAADDATFASGLGWELLEALDTLSWAESVSRPAAPLGWLWRNATPLCERADRISRKLEQP